MNDLPRFVTQCFLQASSFSCAPGGLQIDTTSMMTILKTPTQLMTNVNVQAKLALSAVEESNSDEKSWTKHLTAKNSKPITPRSSGTT